MLKILNDNKFAICLIIIMIIAVFFRVFQLDMIPPGLYPDEAINGNDAITNPGKIFYPDNNGREGLYINLLAFSFSIFGISIWALKIVGALMGALTVFGLYLLAKELFNRNVALFSSFFLAISFWHINFSRIGFRGIMVPFLLVFGFYFLFQGLRKKSFWQAAVSGIFFGLGFHTYISYRFLAVLLPIALFCWLLTYLKEKDLKKFLLLGFVCLFFTFLVALPIGIYFLENPEYFVSRATGVSVFNQENMITAFVKSFIIHMGMFNFYGDGNWRHNLASSPQLFWPVGVFFLIGLVVAIRTGVEAIRKRDYPLLNIYCLLFFWFFLLLAPGVLTYEGIPHALRVIGVIPPVYILAGAGAWKIYQWLEGNTPKKNLLVFTFVIFLFTLATYQFDKYFIRWGESEAVRSSFSRNYVEMGNYLNSLPENIDKYVIVNQGGVRVPLPDGLPMPSQTVMFVERSKYNNLRAVYLLPEELDKIKIEKKYAVVVLMAYDEEIKNKLLERFPEEKLIIKSF